MPLSKWVMAAIGATMAASVTYAEPQTFQLDRTHTHIIWEVERFGFTQTIGSFPGVSGTLILDETDPSNSSVEALIDVTSVRSDLTEREDVIRSGFWLNAETFPTISFQSTGVTVENETTAILSGELTLLGETHAIDLAVTLNKLGTDPVSKNKAAGFSATTALARSDYGLNTAMGFVGDEVSIRIEALAIASNE